MPSLIVRLQFAYSIIIEDLQLTVPYIQATVSNLILNDQ